MALFDPPDGSIDPRPRCTGHCCRGFSLEFPLQEVQAEFQQWQKTGHSKISNIEIISEMLIPLGVFRGQELFTCKHLSKEGNCGIYLSRPQMCRNFPGIKPCPYRNCASHGFQPRWKRIWNWLRE